MLKSFPWNCVPALGVNKTRMMGYRGSRKKFDDIFSRLDTIDETDGQTDGHRTTAKIVLTHSVAR